MFGPRVPLKYLLSGFAIILGLIVGCLYLIPYTMIPIMIAMALAYCFDPFIDYFEEKGHERKRVVFWFFLFIVAFFLMLVTFLIPTLFFQALNLIEHFPDLLISAVNWLSSKMNMETNVFKTKVIEFFKSQYEPENFSRIANWLRLSFTSTAGLLVGLASALIIPVLFYFFLIDIDRMKLMFLQFIPVGFRTFCVVRAKRMDDVLSGFIRGQILVGCCLSCLYSIGLVALCLPYGLVIGMLSGIFNIVPYLGVGMGLGASILMAVYSGKPLLILGVLLVFGIVQVLEGFLITPRIVGDKVGLSPLASIIILCIGGELFGIAGMLISIPLGGISRILWRDCKAAYLRTDFYRYTRSTE